MIAVTMGLGILASVATLMMLRLTVLVCKLCITISTMAINISTNK